MHVVAINNSYSICVSTDKENVKVGDKLIIIGSYNEKLKYNNELLGEHYCIKAHIKVVAVFEKYCICESDENILLGKMPLEVDPNQLSGTVKEVKIGDIVLS